VATELATFNVDLVGEQKVTLDGTTIVYFPLEMEFNHGLGASFFVHHYAVCKADRLLVRYRSECTRPIQILSWTRECVRWIPGALHGQEFF